MCPFTKKSVKEKISIIMSALSFSMIEQCGDGEWGTKNMLSVCSRNVLMGCESALFKYLETVFMMLYRFRWVYCQLDNLRRCMPSSIRKALNELPTTLDDTYERILLDIPKQKRPHARRLFLSM